MLFLHHTGIPVSQVVDNPKPFNRQTAGGNFNFFMGRANNVTDSIRLRNTLTLRDSFNRTFWQGRKAKLVTKRCHFLWDVLLLSRSLVCAEQEKRRLCGRAMPFVSYLNAATEISITGFKPKRQIFLGYRKIIPSEIFWQS